MAVLLAVVAAPPPAPADIIYLKNGNAIEGFIQERYDGKVFILTSAGQIVLREADIDATRAPAPGAAALGGVGVYLQAGQLMSAAREIRAFLERDPAPDAAEIRSLKDLLVERSERIGRALGGGDPGEGRALVDLMVEIASPPWTLDEAEDPLDGRFLVQLASWQHSLGFPEQALATLARLGATASSEADDATRQRAAYLLVGMVSRLLDRSDLDRMQEALDSLRAIAPRPGEAVGVWAWTQVAGRRREVGEFREALVVYRDKILPSKPALAAYRMRAILDAAYTQLFGLRRYDELIALYEEFGLLYLAGQSEVERRYLAALEAAGRAQLEADHPAKAQEYFERMRHLKEREADELILLADYEQRLEALAPDDIVGRYRLGLWATENKLYDRARVLNHAVLEHPEMEESARLQLQVIDRTEELELFESMTQAANEQRYVEAIDQAEEFLHRFELSSLRRQVRELREAAMRDLTSQQNERPFRGQSLFDQAERLYHLQKYRDSLAMLDRVVLEYGDTPAGDRARRLKIEVLTTLYGEILEGADQQASFAALREVFPAPTEADSLAQREMRDEILALTDTLRPYLPLLHIDASLEAEP